MKPDRKGCVSVFVGGKYGNWVAYQNDDDSILLVPGEPVPPANLMQLSLDDDPDIDLKDLAPRRSP